MRINLYKFELKYILVVELLVVEMIEDEIGTQFYQVLSLYSTCDVGSYMSKLYHYL